MADRNKAIDAFLSASGLADAQRAPLAGDASNRRYERVTAARNATFVLMDADPGKGEDVRPFMRIAEHLLALGLSAPRVFASDTENGLLILEDLGDDLFARVITRNPSLEHSLYAAATDVLVALHREPPPDDLAPYSAGVMTEMAALAYQWYRGGLGLDFAEESIGFQDQFHQILHDHVQDDPVLIQRDYHAENLLWLPDRSDVARVGLLDFQDAMVGHRAYDLVSLLQDARRDVSPEIETAMIARYVDSTDQDESSFEAAYAVLGVQRNLRILGVFARLSLHFGKPTYIDFIPRVWRCLLRDLKHPALSPVREQILRDLPEPEPAILNDLKEKCGTVPTL